MSSFSPYLPYHLSLEVLKPSLLLEGFFVSGGLSTASTTGGQNRAQDIFDSESGSWFGADRPGDCNLKAMCSWRSGDDEMSFFREVKLGIHLALSISLVLTGPAQAAWQVLPKAQKMEKQKGNVTKERTVDISVVPKELQTRFWQALTEMDAMEKGGNAVPAKTLPDFEMENGSGSLSMELAGRVVTEMFQGRSQTAQSQWLSYRDLIFIMTYFDLESFVTSSDFFAPVLKEFARLNKEDTLPEQHDYVSLLAAIVAYDKIISEIDRAEKTGSAGVTKPLKDAVNSYFPYVISEKIKSILSSSIAKIKADKKLRVVEELASHLDAVNGKIKEYRLGDDRQENGKTILMALKNGFRFVNVEQMENVLLAASTFDGGYSQNQLREVDLAISNELSRQMEKLVGGALGAMENQQDSLVWDRRKVEWNRKFETDWATGFEDPMLLGGMLMVGFQFALIPALFAGFLTPDDVHTLSQRGTLSSLGNWTALNALVFGAGAFFTYLKNKAKIRRVNEISARETESLDTRIDKLSQRVELVRSAKSSLQAIRGRTLVCEEMIEPVAD